MSEKAIAPAAQKIPLGRQLSRDFKMNKFKYLLILPILVYLILFCYKPMYGLIIAFKNYKPTRGIWGDVYKRQSASPAVQAGSPVNYRASSNTL